MLCQNPQHEKIFRLRSAISQIFDVRISHNQELVKWWKASTVSDTLQNEEFSHFQFMKYKKRFAQSPRGKSHGSSSEVRIYS